MTITCKGKIHSVIFHYFKRSAVNDTPFFVFIFIISLNCRLKQPSRTWNHDNALIAHHFIIRYSRFLLYMPPFSCTYCEKLKNYELTRYNYFISVLF